MTTKNERCTSRILPPGMKTPIRCKGAEGHPADRIHVGATGRDRCHWNDKRLAMWTDAAPDVIPKSER